MKITPFMLKVLHNTPKQPTRASDVAQPMGATTVNVAAALNKLVDLGRVKVTPQKGTNLPLFERIVPEKGEAGVCDCLPCKTARDPDFVSLAEAHDAGL